MISIVIPLYNKEEQIKHTLDSVFDQTFQNFEIVIINDGSTDNGGNIIKGLYDSRIRLITQSNQGVSAARNRGINEARYEYIALLDADDEWKPDYLQTQINLINKYPGCDVFACRYEFKNEKGVRRSLILNKLPFKGGDGILDNYFEVASCSHPPICSISIVARKKALCSIGGFPTGITEGEDLLTWARLAMKYKIAYSMNTDAVYNLDKSKEHNIPPRVPQKKDVVGEELLILYNRNKKLKGLKEYVALWHKMRASIYLRLGDDRNAYKEALISLKYNLTNLRTWVFLFLSFCPVSLRYKLFKRFVR